MNLINNKSDLNKVKVSLVREETSKKIFYAAWLKDRIHAVTNVAVTNFNTHPNLCFFISNQVAKGLTLKMV